MKKHIYFVITLAAVLLSGTAGAFIDPPVLEPNPAQQGEDVFLKIRMGGCDGIFVDPKTGPLVHVGITGQDIAVNFVGNRNGTPVGCGWPTIDHEFSLGILDPGEYTVTVQITYEVAPIQHVTETLDVLTLAVQAPAPHAVPIGSLTIWLLLGLILLVAGWVAIRRREAIMAIPLVLLIAHAPDSAAQIGEELTWIQVVLAHDPEAPTPKDVVEIWDFAVATAPTPSLATSGAVAAAYALPFRAEGDFRARLLASPESPRAKLERSVLLAFPAHADGEAKAGLMLADPSIEAAWVPVELELSSGLIPTSGTGHYGGVAMNIDAAWQWAGGHAFVGVIDTGLFTNHLELRPFAPAGGNTYTYTRGNFLPALSADIGRLKFWHEGPHTGTPFDLNVDERQPELVQPPGNTCATDANGYAPVDFVGHGTHVAGLLGANAYNGTDTRGVCKRCGIGMWRASFASCENNTIRSKLNSAAVGAAITALGDIGVQVINMSLGGWVGPGGSPLPPNPCAAGNISPINWIYGICLALDYVNPRETAMVAASGNDRRELNFPARDRRVVAAGGIDEQMAFWDDDPNGIENCPLYALGHGQLECGSNWTRYTNYPNQEVVTAARQVYSTIYPGFDWNTQIGCGDSYGPGPANDGYGNCTGTSMSAPLISGTLGILRSVNPLVPAGDPWNAGVTGVRDVLATTTFHAQAGQPWDMRLGFGRPDAAAAVRKMLGTVGRETIRNRVTPLFGFYSSGNPDHAYTTSPQLAIALILNQTHSYAPVGQLVPGYPAFPNDPLLHPTNDRPRANTFVLTTEYKVNPRHPDLLPLYLVSRHRPVLPEEYCPPEEPVCPGDCAPGEPDCMTDQGGFFLVTSEAELETLHAQGFHYRGIEGYVYERCTPESSCIPEGAERLWRKCSSKTFPPDCAIFLESERAAFEANGFITPFPSGFPMHIGYAYPNVDTDGDGLIDGFEYLIGTDPTLADTDGDGVPDGVEFPQAGVPVSDPCDGPLRHRCRVNRVFANRFEAGDYSQPGFNPAWGVLTIPEACAQLDDQLTEYEQRLVLKELELEEDDEQGWLEHAEKVEIVEEIRDSISEHCDW